MHSTQPRARQHRDHGLGNHRHVDDHSVALGHSEDAQNTCESRCRIEQFAICVGPLRAGHGRVVDQRRLLAAAILDVAVQRVGAGVQLAVGIPAIEGRIGVVEDALRLAGPGHRPRGFGPERRGVRDARVEEVAISSHIGTVARDAFSIVRFMPADPPPITGVRRSYVGARGVRFHVSEAGPADGRPVVALHGWPQHHWVYRDLLSDPPPGLRIIAPDLPGYGWSGPAPHKWAKGDVATDVLALLDALGLDRVLLLAHDWGAAAGYLMVLREPERFEGYLVCNMAHPWLSARAVLPHLWRFVYQLPLATFGVTVQRRTPYVERVIFVVGSRMDRDAARVFAERFRDPVCA